MTPFLDSLRQGFDALPAALLDAGQLGAARRSAFASLLHDGLPPPRSERWKYTSLKAFERRRFALPDPLGAANPTCDHPALAAIPAPRLVFVNGRYDPALSQTAALSEGVSLRPLSQALREDNAGALDFLAQRIDAADEPFARLNAALALEGAVLRARDGVQAQAPIHLVHVGVNSADEGTDLAWHLRLSIELGRGAQLCVVEHHLACSRHAHLANLFAQVRLAEGAVLHHVRVQDDSQAATVFNRCDATLAGKARYQRLDLELGASLSRNELNIALRGAQAKATANGVLLADGTRHLDTRLNVDHAARDSTCELLWRGLGAARGRAAFHGGILIREGADGTEANLSNKNLLLSEEAEIDTQPVLVIHADEVKAAHGATVGQLDPGALFYLRTRGLPLRDAQRLLTVAFCREPLSAVADSALAALLAAQLDGRLHASGAL
ncbi:MAG: Fe-S cluster assembly protein SufD [Lysobacteraceae bacterium]